MNRFNSVWADRFWKLLDQLTSYDFGPSFSPGIADYNQGSDKSAWGYLGPHPHILFIENFEAC